MINCVLCIFLSGSSLSSSTFILFLFPVFYTIQTSSSMCCLDPDVSFVHLNLPDNEPPRDLLTFSESPGRIVSESHPKVLQTAASYSLPKPAPATKEDKLLAVDLPDSSSSDNTDLLQQQSKINGPSIPCGNGEQISQQGITEVGVGLLERTCWQSRLAIEKAKSFPIGPTSAAGDMEKRSCSTWLDPLQGTQIRNCNVTIDFPSGCVKTAILVSMYMLSGPTSVGISFALRPHGQHFEKPCVIKFDLPPHLHNGTLDTIGVFYSPTDYDEPAKYTDISNNPEYDVHIETGAILMKTTHFCCFGWWPSKKAKTRYVFLEFKEDSKNGQGLFQVRLSLQNEYELPNQKSYRNVNVSNTPETLPLVEGEKIQIKMWFSGAEPLINETDTKIIPKSADVLASRWLIPKRGQHGHAKGTVRITQTSTEEVEDFHFQVRQKKKTLAI